jgi:prophage regulatory protein
VTETSDRFLRVGTVMERTGLSKTTLYRMVRAGSFPKQVQIGVRCTGWRESAIREWIADPTQFQR